MDTIDVSIIHYSADMTHLMPVSLSQLEVQTYPAARFEILLTGEVSEDGARALQRLTAGSPIRIRHITSPGNDILEGINEAIEAADGRWLLFLHHDLLAGPALIERHIQMQEAHGDTAVVAGSIVRHPQITSETFTRWDSIYFEPLPREWENLGWEFWRMANLSVRRQAVLDAGGVATDHGLFPLNDLILARKLAARGFTGRFDEKAVAYSWRPARLPEVQQWHYHMGYALAGLEKELDVDRLRAWILGASRAVKAFSGTMFAPMAAAWGRFAIPGTPVFDTYCRWILRGYAWRGYADAHKGHPRSMPGAPGRRSQ